MKTLIVGTGAVGGYFGGKLARSGADVTFTARGNTLRILRSRGLAVESRIEPSFRVDPVSAVENPAGAGPFDLVVVCVKARDTRAAIGPLAGELAPHAILLSLQNGIESEETIEQALGISTMLRGLAHVGAECSAPGIVHHVSGGTIVVGELDGSRSPRLGTLTSALRSAGIDVRVPDDIRQAKWQKLAWNASFNMVAAISGKDVGAIVADPSARRLVESVMVEVETVAAGRGIRFEPDYVTRVLRHSERNLGAVRPSTLQDRERRRPLEHDALTGAVVRIGETLGVATPVCRALDALAGLLSESEGSER